MGWPLSYDIMGKPAKSFVIALCCLVWFYIQKNGVGYSDVGMSYQAAVDGHYWRIVTSAFSPISVLHHVFNMSALWSLGVIERFGHLGLGGLSFSGVAVGYFCVVFGWMTILSVKQPSAKLDLFGFLLLPISFAPFESLVSTSIIVPQASFLGHWSGIIVGYAIAWGVIHGMNSYWAASMLGAVLFLYSLKRSGAYDFGFLQIESVTDPSLPSLRFVAPGDGITLQMSSFPGGGVELV